MDPRFFGDGTIKRSEYGFWGKCSFESIIGDTKRPAFKPALRICASPLLAEGGETLGPIGIAMRSAITKASGN